MAAAEAAGWQFAALGPTLDIVYAFRTRDGVTVYTAHAPADHSGNLATLYAGPLGEIARIESGQQ
jgi:lipid-A-disaccharide synthase-like uncharacterized protein